MSLENGRGRPERSVIIRLARALDADIQDWLKQCGYDPAAEEEIHAAVESRQLHFAGEKPPEVYFRELRARVEKGRKILMCVAYTSPPGARNRPAVKDLVIDSLRAGLSIALVCPYPKISEPTTVVKPALSLYYADVYNQTLAFARELYDLLDPNCQSRVAMFVPNLVSNPTVIHYVPPPIGLADYRPTMIMDCTDTVDGGRANFELSAWFVMQQDKRDRWLPVFPSPITDQEIIAGSSRHLMYWQDYFAELLATFSEGGWNNLKNDSAWRLEFPAK